MRPEIISNNEPKEFFENCIGALNDAKDTAWIYTFWYRADSSGFFTLLSKKQVELILLNLVYAADISYQLDEVLSLIASSFPNQVIDMFQQRLAYQKQLSSENNGYIRYDAIPFELHKLKAPLSAKGVNCTRQIRGWFDSNYGLFTHRGAYLISRVFPEMGEELDRALLKYCAGSREDILFVIAILRHYHAENFTFPVTLKLISILPRQSDLLDEIVACFYSTGVVHGEFGMSQAYAEKASTVEQWIGQSDQKISEFAISLHQRLLKSSDAERLRAEREILIRKSEYGELEPGEDI
jgi:hypothetical protein